MKNIKAFRVKWFLRRVKRKLTKNPIRFEVYEGKRIWTIDETNEWIYQRIQEGGPLMVSRLGGTEMQAMAHFEDGGRKKKEFAVRQLKEWSGFFPETIPAAEKFVELMKTTVKWTDLLAVWFNPMEDWVWRNYAPETNLGYLEALEPYYAARPWTYALKGKKVLVIHPFAETIQNQYKVREHLFKDPDILPELGCLYTLKAVQTIAEETDERFESWFEALDWMYREALKTDFDIAIIGCGAYGLPLAAKIKEAGRQAVHIGGATQLLFGIKGGRWDQHPVVSKLYNEYWVRPGEQERPKGYTGVEGGCYW